MSSLYLSRLNPSQRDELIRKLFESQKGNCFISGLPMDLTLHRDQLDIDHIEPLKNGGKDDPANFALTFANWNRSKQASDLRVARLLARFNQLCEKVNAENRRPNLGDVLKEHGGSKHELCMKKEGKTIEFSFGETGDLSVQCLPIYKDDLSEQGYFFARLPIEYLHHDDHINPRSLGASLQPLVEEFFKKRPQLHVILAWCRLDPTTNKARLKVFDGQHKAAAQILLGVRHLPVRVFVDPDTDLLLTANTNAGTTLRQVAFDKSVQRHLGSSLYLDRIRRYQAAHGKLENDYSFSENDLVKFFRGEAREMKRYILDAVRDGVTHHESNKLREFIEFGGKGGDRPLSYSTVEKTFYSQFVSSELLDCRIDEGLEDGTSQRFLERTQIVRLMSLIADQIYIGRFDFDIGTNRIENQLREGKLIAEDHVRAFRLSKEEIVWNWASHLRQIAETCLLMRGRPFNKERLFQYQFPDELWIHFQNYLKNLRGLPLWVNKDLSQTVFGGKQNNAYWHTIFETGRTPDGVRVLAEHVDLMKMIRE